jgi:predicted nucleotidyltransferase
MHLLLDSPEVIDLCKLHEVKSLYAFGSIINETEKEESDIDFIVDFKPLSLENYTDNYFKFKFSLQAFFKRKIDLLEEKAIHNPYLIASIHKSRKLIYGQ